MSGILLPLFIPLLSGTILDIGDKVATRQTFSIFCPESSLLGVSGDHTGCRILPPLNGKLYSDMQVPARGELTTKLKKHGLQGPSPSQPFPMF